MGHSAHAAGDVQLPTTSHSAPLPHPASESTASVGAGPADDSVPASTVVQWFSCSYKIARVSFVVFVSEISTLLYPLFSFLFSQLHAGAGE